MAAPKSPGHHTALSALSVWVVMRVAPGTGRFMGLEVISEETRARARCVLTAVPFHPGHLSKFHTSAAAIYLSTPVISYLIFISLVVNINNNDRNGGVKEQKKKNEK